MVNCTEVVLADLWDGTTARYHSRLVWPALSYIIARNVTSNFESMIEMSHIFHQSARSHEVR